MRSAPPSFHLQRSSQRVAARNFSRTGKGASMVTAHRSKAFPLTARKKLSSCNASLYLLVSLCLVALFFTGCGEVAKPVTAPSAGQVHSYFSGPFEAVGLSQSTTAFDHVV